MVSWHTTCILLWSQKGNECFNSRKFIVESLVKMIKLTISEMEETLVIFEVL
jgi:hypothetical protein